jgi:hypothetical protein
VAVLVGDDVGDREVAHRAAVALGAAGQRLVERAVVDVGRELLRDVDRVVAGAVRRGAVAHRAVVVAAGARRGVALGDPGVLDLRLGQLGVLEHLGPVRVDVLGDAGEELLHRLRLIAAEREVLGSGARLRGAAVDQHADAERQQSEEGQGEEFRHEADQ